ncbi:MAG TPA: tyrosine-type recombinase/integrase [Gemmataceae bacterium]|jgi:integrase
MSKSITVREVIALYVRHAEAENVHGPAARADREYTFGLFVAACGDLPVAECRAFHLTDFVQAHPEWKSVATRRSKANAIRAAFRWAMEQERIDRHPFAGIRFAEAERRPALADDVLVDVLAVASKRYERALRFLRLTACRTGELCAATWADVDLDRGVWIIPRHKSRRFTGRPKEVALVPEAVNLLRSIAERQPAGYAGVIFLNSRDEPWTPGVLSQQLRRLKQRHGIKAVGSLHGIRHCALSAMIGAGAALKLVAEQAGHASTAITEKFYWHRSAEHLEAIRAAVALGIPPTAAG